MALQEKYFCSFVQRVLDEPLDMRLHYGHPDLLDKVHFLTRGGVSKASKEITNPNPNPKPEPERKPTLSLTLSLTLP